MSGLKSKSLSSLMRNLGWPKEEKRRLLISTTILFLLCEAPNTISTYCCGEDPAEGCVEVCQYLSHYVDGDSLCISAHTAWRISCRRTCGGIQSSKQSTYKTRIKANQARNQTLCASEVKRPTRHCCEIFTGFVF